MFSLSFVFLFNFYYVSLQGFSCAFLFLYLLKSFFDLFLMVLDLLLKNSLRFNKVTLFSSKHVDFSFKFQIMSHSLIIG